MQKKHWQFVPVEENTEQAGVLAHKFDLPLIVANMLVQRGICTVEAAQNFFHATLEDRFDPALLKGTKKAVERISQALKAQETIVIYGDYDVDGITSTSVMLRCLRRLGGNVEYYIPDRIEEGYGLNETALAELVAKGVKLVITVDCGISSTHLCNRFQEPLDLIVTDHHQPPEKLPQALAVINPKQSDCAYPDKNLAGVGVAYTLCRALWREIKGEDYTDDIELVALGTVADVVPLLAENRLYVKEGLKRFATTDNVGLRALLQVCEIDPEQVTSERIGFSIAPRLNAAGRLAHARLGVQLLTATDAEQALTLAQKLFTINSERQALERELVTAARQRLAELGAADDQMLVVDGAAWHPGVIGIVASRLVDSFHRPALVISVNDGIGKGSCRSIPALDIYDALHSCADILEQFGGHHQAAGFSIREERIPELRKRLQEYADTHLTPDDFIPVLRVERALALADVDLDFVTALERLEPFGEGNPSPLFASRDLTVQKIRRIGKDRRHLKANFAQQGDDLECVGGGLGELTTEIFSGDTAAIVYALQKNTWQNQVQVQGVVKDITWESAQKVHLNREIMVAVYRELRVLLEPHDRTVAQVQTILAEQSGLSYAPRDLFAAVTVLEELHLLERQQYENETWYTWRPSDEKLALENSATYRAGAGKEDIWKP